MGFSSIWGEFASQADVETSLKWFLEYWVILFFSYFSLHVNSSVFGVEAYRPLKPPQGSTFTAFILPSQTRCKWWETFLTHAFSHHLVSISQSLQRSRSSNLRHKTARATLLSNTQELFRSCCAKPQRFMLPHFSFYQAVNLTLYGVAMVTR